MDYSTNTISNGLGTIVTDTYSYVNNLVSNPSVIFIFVIVLLVYVLIFMSLGGQTEGNISNSSTGVLPILFIIIFIILVLINGLQYFFGIDIMTKLTNVFTGNPELDITIDTSNIDALKAPIPEIFIKPQVFNIPDNTYVYSDAKALCSAYGARLATYKEVEDTYNKGGEWCNYGWSDGQMALFPTQEKTFNELQKIEGHENDCGRPGVNGGYISNPMVKFGVNCYGYKPKMNLTEEMLMATEPIYPKTMKDIAMEKRVNYWKDKLSEILVSPFNHTSWSRV